MSKTMKSAFLAEIRCLPMSRDKQRTHKIRRKKQSTLKHVLAISKDAISIDTFFLRRSANDVIMIVEISIIFNGIQI